RSRHYRSDPRRSIRLPGRTRLAPPARPPSTTPPGRGSSHVDGGRVTRPGKRQPTQVLPTVPTDTHCYPQRQPTTPDQTTRTTPHQPPITATQPPRQQSARTTTWTLTNPSKPPSPRWA